MGSAPGTSGVPGRCPLSAARCPLPAAWIRSSDALGHDELELLERQLEGVVP
jgi:hypothetical protein